MPKVCYRKVFKFVYHSKNFLDTMLANDNNHTFFEYSRLKQPHLRHHLAISSSNTADENVFSGIFSDRFWPSLRVLAILVVGVFFAAITTIGNLMVMVS